MEKSDWTLCGSPALWSWQRIWLDKHTAKPQTDSLSALRWCDEGRAVGVLFSKEGDHTGLWKWVCKGSTSAGDTTGYVEWAQAAVTSVGLFIKNRPNYPARLSYFSLQWAHELCHGKLGRAFVRHSNLSVPSLRKEENTLSFSFYI